MSRLSNKWEMGQGLVEYALIILLIAIVVVAALTTFGEFLLESYNNIVNMFP